MKILITSKDVYGETKYYPANDAAVSLAVIAGTKTLTKNTICEAITGLGAEVWEATRTGCEYLLPKSEFCP